MVMVKNFSWNITPWNALLLEKTLQQLSILDIENYGFILNTCHEAAKRAETSVGFPLFSVIPTYYLVPNYLVPNQVSYCLIFQTICRSLCTYSPQTPMSPIVALAVIIIIIPIVISPNQIYRNLTRTYLPQIGLMCFVAMTRKSHSMFLLISLTICMIKIFHLNLTTINPVVNIHLTYHG